MDIPAQRTGSPDGRFRPSTPPFPTDPMTATRHLCAAAHLDETFRETSLREVYHQPRRLVAPSYGFALVPVLAHCLRSRTMAILRDAAIVITFAVAACLSSVALVSAVATLISVQITVATYRLIRDAARQLREGGPVSFGRLLVRSLFLIAGWFAALTLGPFLAGGVLLLQVGEPGIGTDLEDLRRTMTVGAVGGVLLTGLAFLYPVLSCLWRQYELSRLGPGSPIAAVAMTPRLEEIARQQQGNTVVYSGFRPFVGSGDVVGRWSFALRLVRPPTVLNEALQAAMRNGARPAAEKDLEFERIPFDAQDLIEYVHAHLESLRPEREAEEHIPGLTVDGRVFLAGTEAPYLAPYTPPDLVSGVIRHPTTPARHYLTCQVVSWGGEVVTTVHVHVAVQGRSLYLELVTTALPPCDERYRIVSTVEGTGAPAWLRAVRDGLAGAPMTVFTAPYHLLRAGVDALLRLGTTTGAGTVIRGYDHGARLGIRELGAEDDVRTYIQWQDVDKYQRLIERRVIAAVLDFLDEQGVDTREYRARAGHVLNFHGNQNLGEATYNGPVVTETAKV